jgi:hypothetical protein
MPLADPANAAQLVRHRLESGDYYCVVAEQASRITGVNFLDERNQIAGVTTLAVDPAAQGEGIGRALILAVMVRANSRQIPGVRLVTAAGNPKSLVLYSKAGFKVRETMAVMEGLPIAEVPVHTVVRPVNESDLEDCNKLCSSIHGHNRHGELKDGMVTGTAILTERSGRITGYSSSIGSVGHAVGETNEDLQALISSADRFSGRGPIVPTANTELLLWCLDHGMKVQHQVMLMTQGLYNVPSGGVHLPSMTY